MIILLNGTSSAGKTSLARALQAGYGGVLLLYGVDSMVQGANAGAGHGASAAVAGGGAVGPYQNW